MGIKTIIDGWTGPYQFQFLSGGVGVNLTGYYRVGVRLWPLEGTGTPKDFSLGVGANGKLQIDSITEGKVSILPALGDILLSDSPYWVQGYVMWSAAQTSYYPSALPPHPDGVELRVYARAA